MEKNQLKALLGARFDDPEPLPKKWNFIGANNLPDTFDARENWPKCKDHISFIRDQSNCGSCWAVSSAEVFGDRTCIKSDGSIQPYLSDEDVLECTQLSMGCDGGWIGQAFKYWTQGGVCTGGPYGSTDNCKPYSFKPGAHGEAKTPPCNKQCQSGYNKAYNDDKYKGSKYYGVNGDATSIQQEVFQNGPVVAGFTVYDDFFSYTSGVYHHIVQQGEQPAGGHAVKIIGWGTENNTPYWLVANQWNTTWGMDGYFKIQRGNNECGFESNVVAGLA
jgi:cathepsin B